MKFLSTYFRKQYQSVEQSELTEIKSTNTELTNTELTETELTETELIESNISLINEISTINEEIYKNIEQIIKLFEIIERIKHEIRNDSDPSTLHKKYNCNYYKLCKYYESYKDFNCDSETMR